MSELKPCLFCGEAPKHETFCEEDGKWLTVIFCPNCGSGMNAECSRRHDSETYAKDQWNTRYESTCRNKSVEGKRLLLCSKCGAFTKVTNATEYIDVRYCGNCGAEVDGHIPVPLCGGGPCLNRSKS